MEDLVCTCTVLSILISYIISFWQGLILKVKEKVFAEIMLICTFRIDFDSNLPQKTKSSI